MTTAITALYLALCFTLAYKTGYWIGRTDGLKEGCEIWRPIAEQQHERIVARLEVEREKDIRGFLQ